MAGLASTRANAAPKRVVWWYEGATAAQQAALDQYLVKPFNASQSEYELVIEFRGSALPDQLLVALAAGEWTGHHSDQWSVVDAALRARKASVAADRVCAKVRME